MADSGAGHALRIERSCALVASALSEGRREGVRLVSGERRSFGMNAAPHHRERSVPGLGPDWTLRTLTCGIALQCSPSKDRIARYPLHELSARELGALAIVEGEVALGWVASRWPGLLPELRRLLPDLEMASAELDGRAMLDRALALARSGRELRSHPLLGQLPLAAPAQTRAAGVRPEDVRPHALVLAQAHALAALRHDPRRRRRRHSEPEPASAEPARGRRHRDSRRSSGSASRIRSGTLWTESFLPRSRGRARAQARVALPADPADLRGPAPLVRGAHASRDEEPPRGRVRPRHRPLHRPPRRHGDRRGVGSARVPRSAARLPRRDHRAAARRQLLAGRPPGSDLPAGARLRRRAFAMPWRSPANGTASSCSAATPGIAST